MRHVKVLVDLPGVGTNLVDQPGRGAAALIAEKYQDDPSIIDNRTVFAPSLSLANVEQIWPDSRYPGSLTVPSIRQARSLTSLSSPTR